MIKHLASPPVPEVGSGILHKTFSFPGERYLFSYKGPWSLELPLMTFSSDFGHSLMKIWPICFPDWSMVWREAAFPFYGLYVNLSHETFLIICCDVYQAWMVSVFLLMCCFFKEVFQIPLLFQTVENFSHSIHW